MSLHSPYSLQRRLRALYRRSRSRQSQREESVFRSRLRSDPDAPALLISPHWDDAVLDCWGLLASEQRLNVVNMFAGVPLPGRNGVWEATIGVKDSAERARARIDEDALALARVDRKPINLPLLDDQYRRQVHSPMPSLEDLDRAVTLDVQSASRVYVPAGIGAHVDHVLARRFGRMLLRGGLPVTVYAELPYCIFHGWPSWVDGREPPHKRDVDAYWKSFLSDVPEMPPLRSAEVERLDATTASAKCQAIGCYEASLNYGARRLLSDPEFHGIEVRWGLVSPR